MQPPNPANAGSLVGRKLGKYQVLALLALGGTAEIYLARISGEAGFEKYVVVKCLHDHLADDKEFVHMFLDEARLGAQLDHSNIVQTLELGEEDGRYYMVMEFLAGMSLAQIARKGRQRIPQSRIPVDLVLGMVAQACAGLHYAHERIAVDGARLNIVHRDVSPQNLVITFEGMLKLVDFGIAKAERRETSTKSGTIKGKFAYMSPEQCLAQDLDRRTDIFALGTVTHELLTGQRLFKRGSTYETYQAIVAGHAQPPSALNHELDPALDPVVMRALAYDRNDRYPSAEAFGEALLHVLHRRGKSVSASDVSRFFEQYFTQEIDEHAARMRGLIEGRDTSTFDEMIWDHAEMQSDVASQMPDDDPESISVGLNTLHDDELEGESTRIELNPLERVQALHQEVSGPHAVAAAATAAAPASAAQPRRRTIQAPAVVPPVLRESSTAPGKRAIGVPAGTLKPASKTIAPGGLPPISALKLKSAAGAPSAPTVRPVAPAVRPEAGAGIAAAAGKRAPVASRSAPPAAAATDVPRSGQAPLGAVPAPAKSSLEQPADSGPAALPPPPMADSLAEQKTMLAGEAPTPAEIARAAAEADRILAAASANQSSGAPAEQKTMMAGQAPTQEEIARAAAEADQLLGAPGAGAPQNQTGHAPPPQVRTPAQVPADASAAGNAAAADVFPPINTPTAFRQRADLVGPPDPGAAPSGDLAMLASERATGTQRAASPLLLGLAFLLSAAIGLGMTVLIATLAG